MMFFVVTMLYCHVFHRRWHSARNGEAFQQPRCTTAAPSTSIKDLCPSWLSFQINTASTGPSGRFLRSIRFIVLSVDMMLSWGISHSTHVQNGGSTTSNRPIGRQSMRKASCDICCINAKWMQVFIADLQMVTCQTNDTRLYRFPTCSHCPHILTQLPWWHRLLIFLSVAISVVINEHYCYRCSRLYLIT